MATVLLMTAHDPFAVGIRQLAAYVKQHGHTVHMLFVENVPLQPHLDEAGIARQLASDENLGFMLCTEARLHSSPSHRLPLSTETLKKVAEYATKLRPDMIGISSRTWTLSLMPSLVDTLKGAVPGVPVIAGGMGPTLSPDRYLHMGFDLAVRGDGEAPLLDICQRCDKGENFFDILNASYKEGDKIIHNAMRAPIEDLAALPMPLWDDDATIYIENGQEKDINTLIQSDSYACLTSRGCFANCSYCATQNYLHVYRKDGHRPLRHRIRPMDMVLEELRLAKSKGVPHIRIADEFFVRPTEELIDFFHIYNAEIALPHFAYLNATQLIRSETLFTAAVKHMSCQSIGVQTGSERFNKEVYNRFGKNSDTLELAHRLHAVGIPVYIFLIGGCSLMTEEVFEEDLDYVKRLPPFSPRLLPIVDYSISYFHYAESSPLAKRYPFLKTAKYPPKKFFFECMLLYFRRMYANDEETFLKIRNNTTFQADPLLMYAEYHRLVKEFHYKYLEETAQNLTGKEVYFLGAGKMYQRNKHIFKESQAKAILIDKKWITNYPTKLDGIPVVAAEEVIAENNTVPTVIFAQKNHAKTILRRLWKISENVNNYIPCMLPPNGEQL